MKRKIFVLLFFFKMFIILPVHAQKQGSALIDSLLKLLPGAPVDTNIVKVLTLISSNYYNIDPNEGIRYGKQALAIAQMLHWEKGVGLASNKIGVNFWAKSDYDSALQYGLQALTTLKPIKDKASIALIMGNIGMVYGDANNYEKAIEYEQQSMLIFEELGDIKGVARNLGNMGAVYNAIGNYPKALECYFKALKIDEETGDKKGMAINFANIGDAYTIQKKDTQALDYENKALKIFGEIGANDGIAISKRNIGELYRNERQFDKALEYCNMALVIYESIGDKSNIAKTLYYIGNIYTDLSNYNMALPYYFKAQKIANDIGDKFSSAQFSGGIGSNFLLLAEDTLHKLVSDSLIPSNKSACLQKAIEFLKQSIAIAREINYEETYLYYKNLSEAYKLANYDKDALEYYVLYATVNDSINSAKSKVAIANLETVRDLDVKEREYKISMLKKRNEQIMYISGITVLLLIVGFIVWRLYRQWLAVKKLAIEKKKNLQKIEEQSAVLKDITFDQAHTIRAPLTTIMGLVNLFNHEDPTDPVNKEIIGYMAEATGKLDAMVRSVVEKADSVSL